MSRLVRRVPCVAWIRRGVCAIGFSRCISSNPTVDSGASTRSFSTCRDRQVLCAGNETTSPLPVTFCALYSLQGVCGVSTASRRYSPCPVPCRGTTRIDDRFSTAVTSKRDWPVSPLPLPAREHRSGLAGSSDALIHLAASGIRTLSRCHREEAFAFWMGIHTGVEPATGHSRK